MITVEFVVLSRREDTTRDGEANDGDDDDSDDDIDDTLNCKPLPVLKSCPVICEVRSQERRGNGDHKSLETYYERSRRCGRRKVNRDYDS